MARFTKNRWTSAIIPALLIHIPIGTVYCWSVFKQLIADQLHASPASVEWGFSLAIFFLGMSAAFAGPMVEKNIKKSALISMVCFVVGFAGTGVSIALGFLPGVFICYGVIALALVMHAWSENSRRKQAASALRAGGKA